MILIELEEKIQKLIKIDCLAKLVPKRSIIHSHELNNLFVQSQVQFFKVVPLILLDCEILKVLNDLVVFIKGDEWLFTDDE